MEKAAWSYLKIVLSHDVLESLHRVGHAAVCDPDAVEASMYRL